ncbi:MAG: hypothetical protein EA352_03595 [Gemmatimonadales bacterium]|nr:MAG: hypothetical protein EA352_03595 [Gemmatimonadales bacterium]
MPSTVGSDLAPLVARTRGPQPARRIFHATCGLVLVAVLVWWAPPREFLVAALGALTAGAFLADGLRFGVPAANRLFFRLFRSLASPREASGVASSSWYLLGALLTVAIFPVPIAVSAILVLSLADPVASYCGRRWGKRPFGSGTILGSSLFLAVSILVLFPGWGPVAGGVTAVVVTLAERIPWPLDDNLTIPLITGMLLWSLLPLA